MQKLRIVVPAVFATGALLLTGCSSSESGTGAPAGSGAASSPSASPSPSPTDGKSLVQDTTDALKAVDSFHIEGNIAEDGDNLELDITYGEGDIAQGKLDGGDGKTVELRKTEDGTVYANASSEFYAQAASTDSSGPDLSSIAGKWVVVGDDAPTALASLGELLDGDALASSLEPDSDDDETYELSGPEDVDGTSSYIVTDKDGDTFAIAAEGDPLPVKITNKSDDSGEINFDGYGDDVSVDAPDDGEIVPIPS